jgi:hypothetical protein
MQPYQGIILRSEVVKTAPILAFRHTPGELSEALSKDSNLKKTNRKPRG